MEALGFYELLEINRKNRLEYEAKAEARAKAREARAEANCTVKIIKQLLKTKSDEQVSDLLNMPLDYIKEIHFSMSE